MVVFLTILLIGVAIALVALAVVLADPRTRTPRRPLLLAAAGALLLALLSSFVVIVPAGHVGVVRTLGRVSTEELYPGPALVIPFVNSVQMVDTRVQAIRVEGYTAASKEQQDLFMDLTLNYHVKPDQAAEIVQAIGDDYEAKVIRPPFLDLPKSITDDYSTAVVLNSRDEIRTKAVDLLRARLDPLGFAVDALALENFSYSEAYNQAIEDKQVAQQRVQTEQQILEQQKIIAEQKVAAARGDADAAIQRARGEAEANRLVSASLTENILLNRYIEKLVPGIRTILVPGGQDFLLDLRGLLDEQAQANPAP
jgi:prohibitin 2